MKGFMRASAKNRLFEKSRTLKILVWRICISMPATLGLKKNLLIRV